MKKEFKSNLENISIMNNYLTHFCSAAKAMAESRSVNSGVVSRGELTRSDFFFRACYALLAIMLLFAGSLMAQGVLTGTYTGNGSAQSISLGFQPAAVIVTANGQPGFIKSSTMGSTNSKDL